MKKKTQKFNQLNRQQSLKAEQHPREAINPHSGARPVLICKFKGGRGPISRVKAAPNYPGMQISTACVPGAGALITGGGRGRGRNYLRRRVLCAPRLPTPPLLFLLWMRVWNFNGLGGFLISVFFFLFCG